MIARNLVSGRLGERDQTNIAAKTDERARSRKHEYKPNIRSMKPGSRVDRLRACGIRQVSRAALFVRCGNEFDARLTLQKQHARKIHT